MLDIWCLLYAWLGLGKSALPACKIYIIVRYNTVTHSDECTEISLVWNQLIISSCFEACGVQRFHLQEVCSRDWFCILPRMKKSMALFHNYQKFHVMLLISAKNVVCKKNSWSCPNAIFWHHHILYFISS